MVRTLRAMAGLVGVGAVVAVAVVVPAGLAFGAPTPTPTAGAPAEIPGTKVCTVTDRRLIEISGMVATASGYIVVNDGSDVADRRQVFFLDAGCKVTKTVRYPTRPLDTEDLGVSPDGKTLYIADIGDNPTNSPRRATIGLWTMPSDGSKAPVLHRLSYPNGEKHDAEALLFNGDGTPIIVTKEPNKAALYVPTAALNPNQTVPLRRAGQVTIPRTSTPNPLALVGRGVITGGAVAPGGSTVVLRTYADAFAWAVPDGDVVKALAGKPLITPLPNEPWGEAITYTLDGTAFLTVSETADRPADVLPTILRYTPATEAKPVPTLVAAPPAPRNTLSWYERLSLRDTTNLIAGVGLVGVLLVVAGIIGIVKARKRRAATAQVEAAAAAAAPVPQFQGVTYGSPAEPDARRGTEYGHPARGTEYGSGGYDYNDYR